MYILILNKAPELSVNFLLGYFNKLEFRGGVKNVNIVLCASQARLVGKPLLQTQFKHFYLAAVKQCSFSF